MSVEANRDCEAADERSVQVPGSLWGGDTGVLSEASRRTLLALVRGPYLSQAKQVGLWRALIADEAALRSRLHELFLELHIHADAGVAFVRNVRTDELAVPAAVRSHSLKFIDTLMLLTLRQLLLADPSGGRVMVGKTDVFEQLAPYRTPDRDEADYRKRLNSAWATMQNKLNILKPAARGDDERMEISPVLGLVVDAEQAIALSAEFRRIAATGADNIDPSEAEENTHG
ncbi:DUF4194 domain-containing protein [Galactobacter valiniphilus]|uniref:DUF4194 domain-containing protein n=1 Tax=Galactobacter valiniphilus TaxID=2676122 RepID=UPI0037367710